MSLSQLDTPAPDIKSQLYETAARPPAAAIAALEAGKREAAQRLIERIDANIRARSRDRKRPWERHVPRGGIDTWKIHAYALDRLEEFLQRLLPLREETEDVTVWRGRRAEGSPAYEVDMLAGRWCAPGTKIKGDDVVTLVASVCDCLFSDAAETLGRWLQVEVRR